MKNNDFIIEQQQNQILEKFSNFNKYIDKLLELSPDYFTNFINNFRDKLEPQISIENLYSSEIDESLLIKINELQKSSYEISDILRNFENKANNVLFINKETSFRSEEFKKLYFNLKKMNEIFHIKLVNALEEIKITNDDNVSKNNKNIISLKSFNKYNESKIIENDRFLNKLKKNINLKHHSNVLYVVLLVLFTVSVLIFLLLYIIIR